jgi:hypothetical protein
MSQNVPATLSLKQIPDGRTRSATHPKIPPRVVADYFPSA